MIGRLLMILALLTPAVASAQAYSCHADRPFAMPHLDGGADREGGRRAVPTTGYTLSLIWTPEYCRTRGTSARDAAECGPDARFGFTVHGLWPDGKGDQWPQYCRAVGLLPAAVIRQNLCMTPSPQLLQHEWQKHGSCTGSDPARYFADERRLFEALHFPDMDALSRQRVGPGALARAIAAANPGLPASAVKVVPNAHGWLEEVRLCLGLDKRPRACPADQAREGRGGPLKIWRGGRSLSDQGDQAAGG